MNKGLECSVASVLSEDNFDALTADFLGYLESRSVKSWEIKLAMQNDGSVTRSEANYAEKLMYLYTRGREMGIALNGDWYDPVKDLFHTTRRIGDEKVDRFTETISLSPLASMSEPWSIENCLTEVKAWKQAS